MRVARDQRHADFVRGNRSDIDLAPRAPVQFHAVTPRGNAVMPAKGKTGLIIAVTVEARPLLDQRMTSIRTYDPAGAHHVLAEQHAFRMQTTYWSLPEQGNSYGLRPCDHNAVQHSPAHADAVTVG